MLWIFLFTNHSIFFFFAFSGLRADYKNWLFMATRRKIKWLCTPRLNAPIRSVWTESEQLDNPHWKMLGSDGVPSIRFVPSRVLQMQIEDITHMLMETWFDARSTTFRSWFSRVKWNHYWRSALAVRICGSLFTNQNNNSLLVVRVVIVFIPCKID